jgi:hypothetical protein
MELPRVVDQSQPRAGKLDCARYPTRISGISPIALRYGEIRNSYRPIETCLLIDEMLVRTVRPPDEGRTLVRDLPKELDGDWGRTAR